jgi:diguanylate cyclase (GGDEF)-like protein
MISLRTKILLILVLFLCTVGAIGFGVGAYLLNQSLNDFERRSAASQFARVEAGLEQDVDALVRTTVDNAVWDDFAQYFVTPNPQFIEKLFTLESLKNIKVDTVALFSLDGQLHSSVVVIGGQRGTLSENSDLARKIRSTLILPTMQGRRTGANFKLLVDGSPVLVGVSHVRASAAQAPDVGWLVMVRKLDDAALKSLVQTTGSQFQIVAADQSRAAHDASDKVSMVLSDTLGTSALRLDVLKQAGLDSQRRTGFLILLINAIVLVTIAAVGAVLVFDRLVLKRLTLFADKARDLQSDKPGVLHEWPVRGTDELDALALALNDMVSESERARDQLMHDVRTDSLTGLGNRKLLLEKLEHFLGLRKRQPKPASLSIAVLLIDIDDFKIINDSLGHEAGNYLLKEIAHSLQIMVRASDVVARLGGDEFALIFAADNDQLGIDQFASRVQKTISMPRSFNGSILTVSSSIGIAIATDTSDHDTLLRDADLAMYASKSAGKSRHSFFQDVMLANVQERMVLEQQLRECLRQDELEVWFQPILDVRTNEVAMFEALARWPMAGGGFCPPDRFIPVAEESGLIHQLGADVARKVVEAMPALRALNANHIVNINMAPKQLMSKLMVEQMCTLLDNAGLPRTCIHFELTESALASDADHACSQLDALVQAGFHLHLDDFGTGYSSLHRLRSMPFSTLKLDRSFVILMGNGDDRIARVIISLAQQLGMDVIAEGIETAEQHAMLIDLGCHLIQGYYHARPMPLPKLLQWLHDRPAPVTL